MSGFTAADVRRWQSMLARGQVPRAYWGANLTHKRAKRWAPTVREYIERLPKQLHFGRGLYFYGGPRTGKRAAAALILRTAVRLNRSVLFLESETAREASVSKLPFDEDTTMWERMQQVDALAIAHLGDEKKMDDFGASIGALLRLRQERRHITLLTSSQEPKGLVEWYGPLLAPALAETVRPVFCGE